MKVLVPLLTGKENNPMFIEAFTNKVDEVVLLQIVDKGFMSRTSSAIGEVRQFRTVMDEIKKIVGTKKKKCNEITEWGTTAKKILGIAVLQKIDKVFLVSDHTQFFEEVTKELKKNKVNFEAVEVIEEIEEDEKKK
ncbi:Uncharacterised protein [uncultured archaeon]|nr:Uncharacterised protein [uncultured archaeon]